MLAIDVRGELSDPLSLSVITTHYESLLTIFDLTKPESPLQGRWIEELQQVTATYEDHFHGWASDRSLRAVASDDALTSA